MEIGSIIRNARNNAKLSQEQAAEALGVSRQTISNWETGKSYPDIISVIRMSELYSVSLDHLLKEEDSMKQTYKEYLEESTNVVKSNDQKSKLILVTTVLGIWALSLIAFVLVHKNVDEYGYGLAVTWAVLPVTFFAASFIIGKRDWFGKMKWLAAPVFSVMYTMSGYATLVTAENMVIKSVMWPDFAKLPIGLLISLAGIATGILVNKRQTKNKEE
ncbi:MAG: helix-turn-helix transcriptional regulator [Solobacterium sp.]|nr:helix-turn-helix transcriptional regulator [Solobacterium sp.]